MVQVFQQDPPRLGNPLGIPIGPVVAGNDHFALRAVEVAAPVGHDTVGALRLGPGSPSLFASSLASSSAVRPPSPLLIVAPPNSFV